MAEEWRACQAARLRLVPAVRAGVLPALHAEVEGLVEGVELVGRDLALGLAPCGGHRLVHRGAVGQHEVLEPARHHLHALEAQLRTGGFERVARATSFAERFGQDLGHRFPGYRAGRRPDGQAARTGREYSVGFQAHFHRGYLVRAANVRVDGRLDGGSQDPLVDSATDHAATHRHRAVLRTPV